MPEFKLNGKIYDIPEDIVEQFLKDNPNAETLNGAPDFNNSKVRKQFGFNYGEEQKYLRNKTIPERLKNKLGKTTPTTPGAVVEEIEAPENLDLLSGGPSSESLSNLNNKLLDLTASYNNPEKEDITFSESVANSLNNMVERVKQIAPKVNLTSGIVFRKIFGDANVDKFVELAGEDSFWTEGLSKNDMQEAILRIEKSQAKTKETGEIIEGFKEGDLSDIAGGIFNAATSLAPSILEMLAGAGTPAVLGADFFADSYLSINKEKAEKLNISLEELINNDADEVLSPLIFSSAMSAAESFGLGKIASAASKQLTGAAMKKLSNFIMAGTAESGTEIFQTSLEKAQQKYGETSDINQTAIRFAQAFSEQDTWEAGIQGFVGGAGFSGIGNKDIRRAIANTRVPADIQGIEADIEELSNLKIKAQKAKDKTVKKGIENKILEVEDRLSNRIVRTNAIFNFSSDKDINDINNLNDLAELQVKRFNELKKKRQENKITEEEYITATDGYKAEYIKAKERIQGIKSNLEDKSNKIAQEVNKLYEAKEEGYEAKILELYKPMAKKIASKYRNVPGFDMELLTDEILTGERGIFDLIRSYKPETNVPLSAYVNKYARTRAIESAQRNLKTDFELDVTEAKGITDTVTAETQIETKQEAQQEIKKALAQDLNLSEDTQNEIVTAVEKTLGTKLPPVTDKKFRQALTTGFRNELTNTFKSIFGKTAAYEQFLRDNFEKIYPAIPQETINRNFKEFNEPVLDPKTGKQLRERTAEGKKVFKKRDISKAEFIKYFLDAPGNVKGARKTSLAKVLADEIGLDNVLTSLSKPEVVEKFKAIQELQGQEVPSNFKAIISKAINRIDSLIQALDEFEKDKSILKSDFGLTVPAVKVLKLFLKGVKAGLKAGLAIEKAIAKALKNIDKNSEQEQLSAQEQTILKEVIENIPAQEYISKPAKTIINRIDKEYQKKFKEEQSKSIDNVLIPLYIDKAKGKSKAERIELAKDFWRLYWRTFQNIKGINAKEMYSIINDIFGKDFKFTNKSVDGEKFKANAIDQTKTNDFAKKYKNNKEEIIATQHAQADYNFDNYIDLLNSLKEKYNNKEISIDSIYFLLKATGADMNSVGKKIQRLGNNLDIDALNKGEKMTLEHNSPFDFTLKNILLPYILNDIKSSKELINILKLQKLELISKNKADQLNDEKGLNLKTSMPDGYKITDDPIVRLLKVYPNLQKEKLKNKKSLNRQFNEDILQKSTGVKWTETFSPVRAKLMGKGKGKKFFIPYSADDFVGLLYTTLASGKAGDAQMKWYEENLLRPFSRGIQQYEAAKQQALREWVAIKKEAKKNVPGGLNKVNDTGFRNQDAVRLYIWNKQGNDIPGLLKKDLNPNLKVIKNNPKLKEFADRLIALQPEGYPPPSANWLAGDITTDLVGYINGVKRSEFLTEWKDNVDIIFSEKNMNKLRGLYGDLYVEALDNMLHRMRTGTNRYKGADRTTKRFMDWTNNSVGTIMFFNARSAVLQTLSAVNFINFTDNNPINAGLAFANQKQFWNDFAELWSSDFLKQRRSGLQTDVNADEIARAAATAENKAQAVLSYLLKIGFAPTQAADSFAIAIGGASFYRNRIKKYIKEGLSETEAQKKAFTDFQEIAEETQQSARPDRISMQQASPLGRLILAFGNTPMQYARLSKKAALDLINGRGDWKTNISKITYYSVIQNIIFSALQQGLFALLFSDEEDDKEKERYFKLGNGMADTLLRGIGVYGAAAATVKNMIFEIIKQEKSKRPNYTEVAIQSTSISPPINSKLRKLISAGKTFTYKQSREKVFTEGFSLENPAFLAAGQVLSAGVNLPADRMVLKLDHLKTAMEPETELWQSIALGLGWSEWDLGMIEKETKKILINKPVKIQTGLKKNKIKVGIK